MEDLRVVIIDNFDSYTFNVYQQFAQILKSPPLVIRNNHMSWSNLRDTVLPVVDAVVISPGPGSPQASGDFGLCAPLLEYAADPVNPAIPLLGVCLGHQGLAALFKARIVKAPEVMHGRTSLVHHCGSNIFAGIPTPFEVVRYHSLIVDELTLPTDDFPLNVSAWTVDAASGRRLIMSLEHCSRPLYGLQFHPESICTLHGLALIQNFCRVSAGSRKLLPGSRCWNELLEELSVVPTHHSPKQPLIDHAPCLTRMRTCDWVDPAHVFTAHFAHCDPVLWLDSARLSQKTGDVRWSYMGALSNTGFVLEYRAQARQAIWRDRCGNLKKQASVSGIFEVIKAELAAGRVQRPLFDCVGTFEDAGDIPPFLGGLAGYVGYELKDECLPAARSLPRHEESQSPADLAMLWLDQLVCFDHLRKRIVLVVLCPVGDVHAERVNLSWLDAFANLLEKLKSAKEEKRKAQPASIKTDNLDILKEFQPDLAPLQYIKAVDVACSQIQKGETYEVCMTTQFRRKYKPGRMCPLELYLTLRKRNPAPYAAFGRFGRCGPDGAVRWVACSSPERFMMVHAASQGAPAVVTMKPIKGTICRGKNAEEDEHLKDKLQNSIKDRAENLMIVDLIRNDLNLIAATPRSVKVPMLMHIESYQTVHQLVSTIQGDLHPGLTSVDAFKHAFPPGSMTGAPKLRTVRLLENVLEPAPRGVYSGSLGYWSACGSAGFNVVIRTVVGDELAVHADDTPASLGEMTIGAGGALVALSNADAEWDEALLKARAVVAAVVSVDRSHL